ncbi:uncharacterized protein BDZ99DRAFT_525835 [Mytilinidion resinicola]|uniref:Uncharacterized protein n=1 Tax=Mytilinidion resinicola TaxID=574789 RepID=A0A6A6Y622_9PEZI|nr:uncharacterized protein BDZ99DRAFT_525835 [Mytilinidion resinicola]KAF2804242.1 hypothetical protein BDZ99DRAFT_525835 [Mytilinidion resinicola]
MSIRGAVNDGFLKSQASWNNFPGTFWPLLLRLKLGLFSGMIPQWQDNVAPRYCFILDRDYPTPERCRRSVRKRDKKNAKKTAKDVERPKVLTGAEIDYVGNVLHPKQDGKDDDEGPSNDEEIKEIERKGIWAVVQVKLRGSWGDIFEEGGKLGTDFRDKRAADGIYWLGHFLSRIFSVWVKDRRLVREDFFQKPSTVLMSTSTAPDPRQYLVRPYLGWSRSAPRSCFGTFQNQMTDIQLLSVLCQNNDDHGNQTPALIFSTVVARLAFPTSDTPTSPTEVKLWREPRLPAVSPRIGSCRVLQNIFRLMGTTDVDLLLFRRLTMKPVMGVMKQSKTKIQVPIQRTIYRRWTYSLKTSDSAKTDSGFRPSCAKRVTFSVFGWLSQIPPSSSYCSTRNNDEHDTSTDPPAPVFCYLEVNNEADDGDDEAEQEEDTGTESAYDEPPKTTSALQPRVRRLQGPSVDAISGTYWPSTSDPAKIGSMKRVTRSVFERLSHFFDTTDDEHNSTLTSLSLVAEAHHVEGDVYADRSGTTASDEEFFSEEPPPSDRH